MHRYFPVVQRNAFTDWAIQNRCVRTTTESALRPLRQRPREGSSRRPIFELTASNLRRNTTKHGAPDKPCRRRAAATKTADPSGGEAVREAAALDRKSTRLNS